jgi:phage terminase large subunit-like protein
MEGCVGFWRTAHRIAKESDSLVDFIFGKKVLVALNKLSLLTSRVGSHRVSFALKTLVSVDFLLDIDFLDVFFFSLESWQLFALRPIIGMIKITVFF